jgi:hypothetical protein
MPVDRSETDAQPPEQAQDAFFEVASPLGVSDERLAEWFDAWRDF